MSEELETGSGTIQKSISALIPPLLLGLNILVFGTFTVFGENRGEFLVPYSSSLVHYYLPALAIFMALSLLSLRLGKPARLVSNTLFVLLGVLTYIHGNILVWNTGILDGTQLDFSETWRSGVDVLLWITLTWAAFRYRNWLLLHGWKICATLILFQTIGVFSMFYVKQESSRPDLITLPLELESLSSNINVIHIVLDGFQTNIFEDLLTADSKIAENFSGFTLFRDATTPSDVTYLSVPASLSGQVFKNQIRISEYHEQTLNGYNLYSFLASKGFEVDVATPLWWNKPNTLYSSYYPIPTPYAGEQETLASTTMLLGDISIYRQVPYFLKPLVYRSGSWLLSGTLVSSPEQQFQHFAHNAFLTDLKNRMSVNTTVPRYKFIHLVTPHAPFVSSTDCTFTGSPLEYTREAFDQQSLCTLETMTDFLSQLKSSGIYDDSMLIIHGDHGGGVAFDMTRENGTKTTSSEALHSLWGNPLPLVLIKPPGATSQLRISSKQVQLSDIPVTVADQLGFESGFPGQSMFEDNQGKNVERVFFTSRIHRNDAAAKDQFDEFTGYRITGSIYELASWRQAESYESPLADDAGTYLWGSEISFGSNGNFRPLQTKGWSITAAKDVTWTEGNSTVLSIQFPATSGTIKMRARIKPLLAPGKLEQQRVDIFVGLEKVGQWSVSTNQFHDAELSIPANVFKRSGKTEITFKLPDARSPVSLGLGTDRRTLALAFYSLKFEPVQGLPGSQQ
jgi:hypothetical protein